MCRQRLWKFGQVVLVKPGEIAPLDGEVVGGRSQLETSALPANPGHAPQTRSDGPGGHGEWIGSSDGSGKPHGFLDRPYSRSGAKRKQQESGHKKVITRFVRRYTPTVVLLSLLVALLLPLIGLPGTKADWIYRALILLVISCPCGLVISILLGYFGGVGGAAKHGILVKGATYLDTLAAVNSVVFDKTGTLTKGVFEAAEVVANSGFSKLLLLTLPLLPRSSPPALS